MSSKQQLRYSAKEAYRVQQRVEESNQKSTKLLFRLSAGKVSYTSISRIANSNPKLYQLESTAENPEQKSRAIEADEVLIITFQKGSDSDET